jgi:hypothetical protein
MITPSFSLTATERVLPKLALDFTTASLDPRVTFTRTGNTATVVNSSGYIAGINADLPRFDFNPTTLVCSGLLIEESRINVMTYSEDISQFPTKTNTTVSVDQINAPTNQLTADKIIETTATGNHLIFKGNPVVSGTTYTCSVFLKKGERFRARLRTLNSLADTQVDFNLDTGAITAGTAGTITNFGNGWYRCTITSAATATDSNGRFYIYLLDDSGAVSYTGITDYGLYAWGAQVEAGAFATSYIPNLTTGTTTRNADIAVMTGANFSDWYNASEGAFVAQAIPSEVPATDAVSRFAVLVSGTDALRLERVSGNFRCVKTVSGSSSVSSTFAWTIGDTKWFGAAYKLNNNAAVFSAQAPSVLSGTLLSGMNALSFGTTTTGASNWWDGHIQKVMYFPQRLTNAELQAFTK